MSEDSMSSAGSSVASDHATDNLSASASPPQSAPCDAFKPRQLPLTSFANTPQNVACISFVLGIVFALGAASLLFGPMRSESRFVEVVTSPKLGGYAAAWAFFHLLEYVVTATWNPTRVTVSSFLLNNGAAYHVAHTVGTTEFILEELLLPDSLKIYKHIRSVTIFGATLVILGQYVRTLAMATAAESFTHLVSSSRSSDHVLVTHGIYSFSRHPSYAAFLYWAVGTQVWLGNPVGVVGFSLVLWRFFYARIQDEEAFLIRFFGRDYIDFRGRTGTAIPFIR